MKKILISAAAFCLFCAFLNAQQFLDIRRYNNTYEINILPGKPPTPGQGPAQREMNKCQAVRLNKEWFLTAAHCLQSACYHGCTMQARLIPGAGFELISQIYSPSVSEETVKIYRPQNYNKESIAYDLALVKFPEQKAELVFTVGNYITDKKTFMEKSGLTQMEFDKAVSGTNFPTLLLLKAETPKILNRYIIVPSIWGGSAELLSSHSTVYYSPLNQYLFTDNFGIRQGISGSGVFTSTGELVGVVSATGSLRTSDEATFLNPLNYTFLTVFNDDVIRFITSNAGKVSTKTSDMSYMKVIPEDQRPLVFGIEKSIK